MGCNTKFIKNNSIELFIASKMSSNDDNTPQIDIRPFHDSTTQSRTEPAILSEARAAKIQAEAEAINLKNSQSAVEFQGVADARVLNARGNYEVEQARAKTELARAEELAEKTRHLQAHNKHFESREIDDYERQKKLKDAELNKQLASPEHNEDYQQVDVKIALACKARNLSQANQRLLDEESDANVADKERTLREERRLQAANDSHASRLAAQNHQTQMDSKAFEFRKTQEIASQEARHKALEIETKSQQNLKIEESATLSRYRTEDSARATSIVDQTRENDHLIEDARRKMRFEDDLLKQFEAIEDRERERQEERVEKRLKLEKSKIEREHELQASIADETAQRDIRLQELKRKHFQNIQVKKMRQAQIDIEIQRLQYERQLIDMDGEIDTMNYNKNVTSSTNSSAKTLALLQKEQASLKWSVEEEVEQRKKKGLLSNWLGIFGKSK